jgi:dTDP-4-amino-4,6-dideoxygalactose transaminase
MAIIKTSPSELAIHGGGPAAFASKVPVFSANVGDGHRFAELAERMFMATELPGRLVEEFESSVATWLDVRNVIGFSSLSSAVRCLDRSLSKEGRRFMPAFGAAALPAQHSVFLECEGSSYGLSPSALAENLKGDAAAVFAVNPVGRTCHIQQIEDICDEWDIPLFLYGHQSLGRTFEGELLGSFGRAEIFDLGRDQLVHALDASVITTDDDLLAHRLRSLRALREDGIDPAISDAAAAMGIANSEAVAEFVAANRSRYEKYSELLSSVPGMKLVRADAGSTYQSITIEVDPGLAGLTRDSLADVLTSENAGTAKPFEGSRISSAPRALRVANSLLHLPAGPSATDDVIQAVCKLIELAVVRSLESPDPIRLAA